MLKAMGRDGDGVLRRSTLGDTALNDSKAYKRAADGGQARVSAWTAEGLVPIQPQQYEQIEQRQRVLSRFPTPRHDSQTRLLDTVWVRRGRVANSTDAGAKRVTHWCR